MLYEIVIDAGETPNKCTITPQANREDFRLFPARGEGPIGPLNARILLHHEGECLEKVKAELNGDVALACVDCVWRRLPRILTRIEWNHPPILAKIPDGFVTVYPRVGYYDPDPEGGLATIEALFVAAAILGHWDLSLLSKYYFGRKFIEVNTDRFLELGIHPELPPADWPQAPLLNRNSLSRKKNRGRLPKS